MGHADISTTKLYERRRHNPEKAAAFCELLTYLRERVIGCYRMTGSAKHVGEDDHRRFKTTHWSVVAAAGDPTSPEFHKALATLCENYWYPVYVYIRRLVQRAEEAEDLTQGFFTVMLEKQYLRDANAERGKFRSFLLVAVKHFLSKERDRVTAQKRGGKQKILSLEFSNARERYKLEPTKGLTPEQVFDHRWALTVLDAALCALCERYTRHGKADRFERLKIYLEGKGPETYAEAATALGITEDAVKQEVRRLRKRCRELLIKHISETLVQPEDIDDEVRHLFEAMRP